MKIFYDNIIFSLQKSGGISVYFYEIINSFKNKEITLLKTGQEVKNIFYKKITSKQNVIIEKKLPLKLLRYMDVKIKNSEKFIFHSSYYRICKNKNALNVTTVHDFTYEKYFNCVQKFLHHFQKRRVILKSDLIICISENTKRDLLHFIPEAKNKNIKVIYNGVSEEYYKKSKMENKFDTIYSKINYILYVGARSGYKRFDIALNLIVSLNYKYKLIFVGGEKLDSKEEEQIKDITMNNYIHIVGITNADLNSLYNYAFCLIYPSEYEGFGIPIVEAMRAGCPVLAYENSSIPEVSGSSLLVKKNKVEEYFKNIKKLKDNNIRKKTIQNGIEYSKRFSWKKMIIEIKKEYKNLENRSRENE